jgi:hypothetical protein
MDEMPATALLLAGVTLAHSAWSVSDTGPEELLVPLALIEQKGDDRRLREREAVVVGRLRENRRPTGSSTSLPKTGMLA